MLYITDGISHFMTAADKIIISYAIIHMLGFIQCYLISGVNVNSIVKLYSPC